MSLGRVRSARLPLAAALVGTVLLAPAAIGQDSAPVTGYWSRTVIGAPSPVEAPVPVVPEGGTWVAGGAADGTGSERDGALAVSALRLELPVDAQAGALSLAVADVRGEPVVTVCAAAARWDPVQGGRFDEAPPADCTLSATGTVQEGRLVATLDGVVPPGPLDVVLLPGQGSVFSLTLEPATAESVTVAPALSGEPISEVPFGGPIAPPPSAFAPTSELPPFDPSTALAAPPPLTGPPLLAAELPPLAAQPTAPQPQAAPPQSPLAVRPAAFPFDDRRQALPAAALLVGLAVLALRLGATPARAPRALGGAARLRLAGAGGLGEPGAAAAAAGAAAAVRGVGRFRRERDERPVSL